jgi:hypothetical protein
MEFRAPELKIPQTFSFHRNMATGGLPAPVPAAGPMTQRSKR